MGVPFPDVDPYEELGVANDAVPPAIKKAYYKLCLKYHPDKLQKESKKTRERHTEKFQRVQFSYSILKDAKRRARYDASGSVEDSCVLDDDFDWKDFFKRYTETKVTEEMIDQDKKQYQNSAEERDDVLNSMEYYKGQFLRLFEAIPHLEFSKKEEERVFKIVEGLVEGGELEEYPAWKKYVEDRKKEVRKMLRKSKKEAKEAEKVLADIKAKNKKKDDSQDTLSAMIKANHKKRKDPFEQLVAKYSKNSRGRASGKSEYDMDDEEFERVQKEMLKK